MIRRPKLLKVMSDRNGKSLKKEVKDIKISSNIFKRASLAIIKVTRENMKKIIPKFSSIKYSAIT